MRLVGGPRGGLAARSDRNSRPLAPYARRRNDQMRRFKFQYEEAGDSAAAASNGLYGGLDALAGTAKPVSAAMAIDTPPAPTEPEVQEPAPVEDKPKRASACPVAAMFQRELLAADLSASTVIADALQPAQLRSASRPSYASAPPRNRPPRRSPPPSSSRKLLRPAPSSLLRPPHKRTCRPRRSKSPQ